MISTRFSERAVRKKLLDRIISLIWKVDNEKLHDSNVFRLGQSKVASQKIETGLKRARIALHEKPVYKNQAFKNHQPEISRLSLSGTFL